MKKIFFLLCIGIISLSIYSCSNDPNAGEPSIAELQKQIQDLKNLLEKNHKIRSVAFEGQDMILTFEDGSVFRTATPASVIPNIGTNGNWWVNGEDLGVKAVAQIPVVGDNGNWWIDGKDSGKSAQGIKGDKGDSGAQGDKGDKGDTGNGIAKVEYDEKTGILKITLTDKTFYEFGLGISGEGNGNVGGNRLDDLNGAYLLSKIWNGDFPFAAFTYDANNNMTGVTYYQNVLNAPAKFANIKQEYNVNGKVIKQTFATYALKDELIQNNVYVADWDIFQLMTTEQLFSEFYPQGFSNGNTPINTPELKREFIHNLINQMGDGNVLYSNKFAYYIGGMESNERFRVAKFPLENKAYMLTKENGQFYVSYRVPLNGEVIRPDYSGFPLANITLEVFDGHWAFDLGNQEFVNYFTYNRKTIAKKYTGPEDELVGNTLTDYQDIPAGSTLNLTGETGKFKYFVGEYEVRKQGEVLESVTLNYTYTGNEMGGSIDGENQFYVMTDGDKITKIMDWEKTEILRFNYNADGNISTIDLTLEGATEIAKFEYDTRKNPTALLVNSSKLAGKGYDDLFCTLGLAYRYEIYDEALGKVVKKVKYTNGYAPVLKINYNYGLKNFMNHTLTASNPLLKGFNTNNAISELLWAGHGSCFMAEYSDYNEGGYPTRFKGILQLSDSVFEDESDMGSDIINGSVATLYKLEYQKKQ